MRPGRSCCAGGVGRLGKGVVAAAQLRNSRLLCSVSIRKCRSRGRDWRGCRAEVPGAGGNAHVDACRSAIRWMISKSQSGCTTSCPAKMFLSRFSWTPESLEHHTRRGRKDLWPKHPPHPERANTGYFTDLHLTSATTRSQKRLSKYEHTWASSRLAMRGLEARHNVCAAAGS